MLHASSTRILASVLAGDHETGSGDALLCPRPSEPAEDVLALLSVPVRQWACTRRWNSFGWSPDPTMMSWRLIAVQIVVSHCW